MAKNLFPSQCAKYEGHEPWKMVEYDPSRTGVCSAADAKHVCALSLSLSFDWLRVSDGLGDGRSRLHARRECGSKEKYRSSRLLGAGKKANIGIVQKEV